MIEVEDKQIFFPSMLENWQFWNVPEEKLTRYFNNYIYIQKKNKRPNQ